MNRPRGYVSLLVLLMLGASPGRAADWFVAPPPAGAAYMPGEGSRQRPFSDLWRALEAASAGDSIHIAEGIYHGRFDRSAWVVDRPKLTLLGGYDREFTRRDPWKQPSVLAFYRGYEGPSENNLLYGLGDHSGLVVDGLVIDGAGRNRYNPAAPFELRGGLQMVTGLAAFGSPDVTIRNCTFLNSTTGGVELRGEGSRFENNIVVNLLGQPMLQLRETSGGTRRPFVVRGNTFAFAHDETDPPMGKGGEKGVAIRLAAPATIENNVFAACGNAGIHLFAKPGDVSINNNIFSLMCRGDVAARIDGREMLITDKNLEEMEDLGFKSSVGNKAADAGLSGLKAAWVEGVSKQMLWNYATPPKEALAALRKRYELPEAGTPSGDDRGPTAPLLEVLDGSALRVTGEAGARPVELKVALGPASAAAAAPTYTPVTWGDFNAGAPSLEGKPVELVAAIGNERNGFVKSGVTAEGYLGFDVFYPGGDRLPDRIHVYAVRHGPAHRQWEEAAKSSDAKAEDWYLLRGIARLTGARQRATLEVQSIVPGPAPAANKPPRPRGKEMFVRAGATGGDGTRDKPFRDPFQALEKAADGDIIRVAGGEYFGRLRTANWKIGHKYLTLLGGYDAQFTTRDPWKNPTRLAMPADAEKADKSAHGGRFLESSEICNGLILDGFVFDASSVNTYFEQAGGAGGGGGGLNLGATPLNSMVQLQGPDITIRNCVFANASGTAVELSSAAGLFENNIVVNSSGMGVRISALGPGPWIIRRNTFLFSMDPTARAGTGLSSAGSHLLLSGRAAARLEGNLFGFADNYAVRSTIPRAKLSLEGNIFAANLHCHLTDVNRVWLHDDTWERRLADAGFVSAQGNSISMPAGLTFQKEHLDKALTRLFALKGRYPTASWEKIAARVGASVRPPADGAPAAAEKPKEEKPKEQTLEDLMRELDSLKQSSARETGAAAPKGPPYAPAYPWKAALELAGANDPGAGAHRVPAPLDVTP